MIPKFILFFLRPLAEPMRYGALKLMKRMRPPNDKHPAMAASDHLLNEIVLPSVFHTFREDAFRELARFKKLPVSEHDRIFNELEVAGVCVAVFYLRAIKTLVRPEDYHFWQDVEECLPKELQRILIGYGVDGANAKLMRELINMRRTEYEKLAEHVWEASDDARAEFKTLPEEMKRFVSWAQGTAIGTTDHIRRGKLAEKDPLISYLMEWFMSLRKKVNKFVKHL